MSMEDLASVGMTVLIPQIADQMAATMNDDDWRAIDDGTAVLDFHTLLRGRTVEVTCKLNGRQLFTVSQTMAPAAQA